MYESNGEAGKAGRTYVIPLWPGLRASHNIGETSLIWARRAGVGEQQLAFLCASCTCSAWNAWDSRARSILLGKAIIERASERPVCFPPFRLLLLLLLFLLFLILLLLGFQFLMHRSNFGSLPLSYLNFFRLVFYFILFILFYFILFYFILFYFILYYIWCYRIDR